MEIVRFKSTKSNGTIQEKPIIERNETMQEYNNLVMQCYATNYFKQRKNTLALKSPFVWETVLKRYNLAYSIPPNPFF
jgi:ABC-type maltose transport system permease subunit